jgi:hypothetical protein
MISASISDSDAGRLLEGKNAPAVAALMWDCGCSCQLLADQLLAEWPAALCGAGRGPQTSAFNVCVLDLQSTMDLQSISSINPVVS